MGIGEPPKIGKRLRRKACSCQQLQPARQCHRLSICTCHELSYKVATNTRRSGNPSVMLGCCFLHCYAAATVGLHSRNLGGPAQGNTPLTLLGARKIPVNAGVQTLCWERRNENPRIMLGCCFILCSAAATLE